MAARFSEPGPLSRSERHWRGMVLPLILLSFLLASQVVKWGRLPLCGFLALTGVPCPFCGGTRACAALATGDTGAAWQLNPGVCGIVAVAFVHAAVLSCEALCGRSLGGQGIWPAVWSIAFGLPVLLWFLQILTCAYK